MSVCVVYRELLEEGKHILAQAEIVDAECDAWLLLEHVSGMNRAQFFLHQQDTVPDELEADYRGMLRKRAEHIPLQHLTGTQEFMGLEFQVSPDVLIPRQDTELLVEKLLPHIQGKRVLDVCTGSGCIAISLAVLGKPEQMDAVDLSEKALIQAGKNAKRLGADVSFYRSDMLDEIIKEFPEDLDAEEDDDIPKVAVVGKPNVGKSSLINKLLGEDRVIVSDIAGTTRDAVDAKVKWKDREYIFIDTAGLRRKGKIKEEIERYSVIRTVTAVERADVVVVVIDATEGVTEQDAKIAGIAHERGKGVIIAVNKWDAVEKDDKTIYKHTNRIREVLAYMPYAELVFISAKSGQRLPKLFETIDAVIENQTLRIQTGVLNEILSEAVAMQQPPSDRGKRLKIFYMTQVGVKPPTFVIFVNDKELMHFSYTRYIENKVRDAFGFRGTSLKFIIRERGETS